MRKIVLLFAAFILVGLPVTVMADTFTFQAPATAPNQGSGGPNQFNLDHHDAYTWQIDNVNVAGKTITGATLTFTNISNWDANPNMLFIHLLDSAKNAGVSSFVDAPLNQAPVTSIARPASASVPEKIAASVTVRRPAATGRLRVRHIRLSVSRSYT